MKSGEIASALGVSLDTIKNWTKHPLLSELFSPSAKGEVGNFQRLYTENDVAILSTIHYLRTHEKITDWELISKRLDQGERFTEFPQNAIATDPRTIPIQQAELSTRAAATLTERDAALKRVTELEEEIRDLLTFHRTELEQVRNEHKVEVKELHVSYQKEMQRLQEIIAQLNREIGRLEGMKGQSPTQDI